MDTLKFLLERDDSKYPDHAHSLCLIIFGAHMMLLLINKVKILVLIKWIYRSSPLMLTTKFRMVSVFGALSPISVKHVFLMYVLRCTPDLTPLNLRGMTR